MYDYERGRRSSRGVGVVVQGNGVGALTPLESGPWCCLRDYPLTNTLGPENAQDCPLFNRRVPWQDRMPALRGSLGKGGWRRAPVGGRFANVPAWSEIRS